MATSSLEYTHNEDELDKGGGYNVKLWDEGDVLKNEKFICPFCKLLMRNPVQTCRGELACSSCYQHAKKRDSDVCPIDGEPITANDIFKDRNATKTILQLQCFCRNNSCLWVGSVCEVEKHESECQCTPINCYLCGEDININEICSHLEICLPKNDGRCVYDRCYGYKMMTTTSELHQHLEENVIQHAILNATALSNIRDDFNKQLESKAKTYVEREEGLVAQVNKLQNTVTTLVINMNKSLANMQHTVNQLENNAVAEINQQSSHNNNNNNNLDMSDSIKIMKTTISDLDLKQQLFENTSYNGRLLWKVDNITKRLNQAILGKVTTLHSAPQFTKRYGYKFCGRLYLNGDGVGRGTHISMFFVVMKSDYDNLLTWPFYKKVKMRLLNQIDPEEDIVESFIPDKNSSSFIRPKKDMNIAAGCPMFVARELFLNGGYIKDDCVFIDLSVCNDI